MNYEKLYHKMMEYCNNTCPAERMILRDADDPRIGSPKVYTEIHHIIPKHDGGKDIRSNYVILLPEEHIIAHKIRWKAYQQRGDMLSVRFCLNGFHNKGIAPIKEARNSLSLSKTILRGYIWLKQNSYDFRIKHGWQTPEGVESIRKHRMGKMPVKDSITGEMIGSVPVDHDNVKSGKWVHHSKGNKIPEDMRESYSRPMERNGRYSGITDSEIIRISVELSKLAGRICSIVDVREYAKKKYGINIPKSFSKNRFNGECYYDIVERETKMKYNPYLRGSPRQKHMKKFKEILNGAKNDQD